ncbi:FAD-dependent monooxygenase [Rhodococcus sp. TAF43]|uniref:FAD-dependent monooxygenase n=1 Tax=Rhodococcus sp. TAF43 TaxID=3237483 RepID=UPI003F9773B6
MTNDKTYDTDVLVIGSGPAGGSAALLLATYGVDTMLVNKYGWVANTPRAHITNQRTLEVLRDLGVEAEALAQGTPQDMMGDTVLCTSLAGEEIGRISTWGAGEAHLSEYSSASPCPMIDLPQTYMEPILVTNAAERGAKCRFDTEFVSLEQDADGVTATLRDRLRGDEYTVRAKYLIGADGARSVVAEQIGLPIAGRSGVGGSMNICFTADLSRYCEHRPSVLYWAMRPGAHMGGIGMGLIRMVRPWNEWLLTWGYDIEGEPPTLDEDEARRIVLDLLGDDSIDVQIDSTSLWTVNHSYATEYSRGISGGTDEDGIETGLAMCRAETAEGAARRRALIDAIELKNYEFNAHGVELNQRYASSATVPDSSAEEEWVRDRELFAKPTTRPGAKLPHAWLVDGDGLRRSTLDVVGRGQFSVVTGLSGGVWERAAAAAAEKLDIPIRSVRIDTPGLRDAYGRWARLREIAEDGVLLVRPDGYVAWRRNTSPNAEATATAELTAALTAVLDR